MNTPRGRGSSAAAHLGLIVAIGGAGLLAAGCAHYTPRPIEREATFESFEARRLTSPELGTFLREQEPSVAWPPSRWNLRALASVAFYYSPVLDVARAQWGVARGGVITAGGRPNPAISAAVGYNATTDPSVVSPWIWDVALELPLDIAGKRGIRIAEATRRSEAARFNLITVAWGVRARVRRAYLALYVANQSDSLLTRQREIGLEAMRIFETLREVGEVAPTELTRARVDLATSRVAALDALQRAGAARSELADALGVPPSALDGVVFAFEEWTGVSPQVPSRDARRRALLNRSDILGALASYEASQKALQLAVREQYPDLTLGPAFQFDQDAAKWTLGLGFVLPLLNRNEGPIAEAAAQREEEEARFMVLQSKVVSDVARAVVAAETAASQVAAADTLLDALRRQQRIANNMYEVGEISRLELLGLQAETVATALSRLDALAKAQDALGALEDAMQSPLDLQAWVLVDPRSAARAERESR